ncbi:MAG: hypothetical protein ABW148_06065 [Sedimenticola sp.]
MAEQPGTPHDEQLDRYSDLTTKEALHRIQVMQSARDVLAALPEDPEAHRQHREKLFDQAEHYKRIFEGLLDVIQEDLDEYGE